jgi:hypothetical protein
MLKTCGYLVSTLSVVLLAIPSLKAASEQPMLFVALIGGMVASMAGMFMRWLSYELETRRERQAGGFPSRPTRASTEPSNTGAVHARDFGLAGGIGDRGGGRDGARPGDTP